MGFTLNFIPTSTMIVLKPLNLLDRIATFLLTFPLISLFFPHFLRIWLIKTVVCLKIYLIGFICCLKQLLWRKELTVKNDLNVNQPLALITGGTSGIGLALCQLLAPKWRLIILGRDRRQGHLAIEEIKRRCGQQSKVIFYAVDLSSRKSINEFLEIFIKTFDRLHLLVNNAGVMMVPYQPVGTSGDIELQWAVNFLAPVYLADRLRPCLERALRQDGFSRVINLTSAVLYAASLSPEYFACAGGCNGSPKRYSSHLAYANSKLALSLYTQQQAERYGGEEKKVLMCSVHPGVVSTDLYRHSNFLVRWFVQCGLPLIKGRLILTPDQSAKDVLWACLSPNVESGGYYENGCRQPLPPGIKEDAKLALWKHLERQDIVSKIRH